MSFFKFIFRGLYENFYETWMFNVLNKSVLRKPTSVSTSKYKRCFSTLVSWGISGVNTKTDKNKVLKYYKYEDFFINTKVQSVKRLQSQMSRYRKSKIKGYNGDAGKGNGKNKSKQSETESANEENDKKLMGLAEKFDKELDVLYDQFKLNRVMEWHDEIEKATNDKNNLKRNADLIEEKIKKKYKHALEGKRYKDKVKQAEAKALMDERKIIGAKLKEAERYHSIENDSYEKKCKGYLETSKKIAEVYENIIKVFCEKETYENSVIEGLDGKQSEIIEEIRLCMKKSGKNSFGNINKVVDVIIHCLEKGKPVSINTGYKGIKPRDHGFRRSTWLSLLRNIAAVCDIKLRKCGKVSLKQEKKDLAKAEKRKGVSRNTPLQYCKNSLNKFCTKASEKVQYLGQYYKKNSPSYTENIDEIVARLKEMSNIINGCLSV